MKLIVGLGNPGDQYIKTRHNIGFLFLDYLIKKEKFKNFKLESKFKGEITTSEIAGEKVILLKPQTYMNLSGESIRKIVDFYKIDISDIIVIYDDISMDFGKIRYRTTGSSGGHNGIKDIIKNFGSNFKRIKIGVGFNNNYEVSDWVLSKFSEYELDELENNIFNEVYNSSIINL